MTTTVGYHCAGCGAHVLTGGHYCAAGTSPSNLPIVGLDARVTEERLAITSEIARLKERKRWMAAVHDLYQRLSADDPTP